MVKVDIPIWLVLLGLTIFSFIVSYVRAYIDAILIKKLWGKVKSLVHSTRVVITLFILILFDFILWYKGIIVIEVKEFTTVFDLGFYISYIRYLFILSYQWFWYSFYFDIILNRMRGLNDWYVGQTSTMDIMVRKTFGMNSGRIYGMIKIVFVIFSTIGIIKM
jgi:hypothetical protein